MSYFRYVDNGEGPTKLFIGGVHGNEGKTSLKFIKRLNIDDFSKGQFYFYNFDKTPYISTIKKEYYKKCDHLKRDIEDVQKQLINKSEEDVERLYSDWKIEGYSPNEIVIYKEYDGICGDHYIVKEHNGVIGIYKLDSVGNEIFVEDTELQIQYLPEIDIIKLKEGITALGQAELNSVLEDFE